MKIQEFQFAEELYFRVRRNDDGTWWYVYVDDKGWGYAVYSPLFNSSETPSVEHLSTWIVSTIKEEKQ